MGIEFRRPTPPERSTTSGIYENTLLEANSSNVVQAAYTLEPVAFGNLISQARGGVTSIYLFDASGSTRQLTNLAGVSTDAYVYDAFGNPVVTTGTSVNWFRYIGRLGYYRDLDLSQYYVRARYYDPHSARFLSADPFEGDSPTQICIGMRHTIQSTSVIHRALRRT